MTAYPQLRYRDARAAIDWLERAFGFAAKEVHDGPDSTVAHAELRAGDGLVMLGSEPAGGDPRLGDHAGQSWVYVAVADVVMTLRDTDYGSRDFSARDPDGNLWSFGTYRP